MRPLLLTAASSAFDRLPIGRRKGDVEVRHVPVLPAASKLDPVRPVVVVVDEVLRASVSDPERHLAELSRVAALVLRGRPGDRAPSPDFPGGGIGVFLPADAPDGLVRATLEHAVRHAIVLRDERVARAEADRRRRELHELAEVGVALATERDLARLLSLIVEQARRLTSCDAASLYLVEPDADGRGARLRFKLAQNQSCPVRDLEEFTLPLDSTSLAGHVASTGEALCIPDVRELSPALPYAANRSFDARTGYRTRSMLVLPLVSHRAEVVGVLQLINRKRDPAALLTDEESVEREVVPFTLEALEPATALAAHAAVAIENGLLHASIESLFEGFVTAAVEAIDSRDPTTSGHSSRVAALTVAFAEALATVQEGPYAGVRFTPSELRELRYAALLHDFGKVAVREEILLKERKLPAADLVNVRHRVAALIQAEQLHYERQRAEWLLAHGHRGYAEREAQLAAVRDDRQAELRDFLERVEQLDDGRAEEREDQVRRLLERSFVDGAGVRHELLTPRERAFLSIPRGTLDEAERAELEAHVLHTDRFLRRIPWTPELARVPEIAFGHHEKLNGVGYPLGLRGDAIPLGTRLITIADVFDALTASDRSYRGAVSVERALDILHSDALAGELDLELLRVFREARVWERAAQLVPPGSGPSWVAGASRSIAGTR